MSVPEEIPSGTIIGLGIDLVEVDRMTLLLSRRARAAERLFSDAERAYADRFPDPGTRLSARFAAKEAVMKALGVGLGAFGLRDVEVARAKSGAPSVVLHGRAAALAESRGVRSWQLALTHTETTAAAVAIALG